MKFEIIDKNNQKITCDVIATYHDEETNKDFIIYTDRKITNQKLNLYYALYKEVDGNIQLIKITSNRDKKIGLQLLEEIIKEYK